MADGQPAWRPRVLFIGFFTAMLVVVVFAFSLAVFPAGPGRLSAHDPCSALGRLQQRLVARSGIGKSEPQEQQSSSNDTSQLQMQISAGVGDGTPKSQQQITTGAADSSTSSTDSSAAAVSTTDSSAAAVSTTDSSAAAVSTSHGGHAHANSAQQLVAPARPKLAAYYQVHSQASAMNATLAAFRKWYPDAPILVVNDGGEPKLKLIADHYRATYRYVSPISDSISSLVPKDRHYGVAFEGGSYVAATWIHHVFQALGDAEWLLNMEDDVQVLQHIDFAPLKDDVCGDNPGVQLPEAIRPVITELGGPPRDWHYGGCGGTLFRGDFWRMVRHTRPWMVQIRAIIAALTPPDKLLSDQVISALALANGGTIGPFPGFAENWYHDLKERVAAGRVAVHHMDKSQYNVPFAYEALEQRPAVLQT